MADASRAAAKNSGWASLSRSLIPRTDSSLALPVPPGSGEPRSEDGAAGHQSCYRMVWSSWLPPSGQPLSQRDSGDSTARFGI